MKIAFRWVMLTCAVSAGFVSAAHAQAFVQLGGGWSSTPTNHDAFSYSSGSNFQGSVGLEIASRLIVRGDALIDSYRSTEMVGYASCASTACPACQDPRCGTDVSNITSSHVTALMASAMINVDSRGVFYLLGGVGAYRADAGDNKWHGGASAGAGLAVPVDSRWRVFCEARRHFRGNAGAPFGSFVPITLGLRLH